MKTQNESKKELISALEEDLLTPLYKEKRLYGLQFINAFEQASGGERKLGLGSLYPTLARLERESLLEWHWGEEEIGARRKYYTITSFGKFVLEKTWRFRKALLEYAVDTESETIETEDKSVVKEKQSLQPVISQN